MLQLSLDIASETALPLVDQIVGGIRTRIDDRVLRPAMVVVARNPQNENTSCQTD